MLEHVVEYMISQDKMAVCMIHYSEIGTYQYFIVVTIIIVGTSILATHCYLHSVYKYHKYCNNECYHTLVNSRH